MQSCDKKDEMYLIILCAIIVCIMLSYTRGLLLTAKFGENCCFNAASTYTGLILFSTIIVTFLLYLRHHLCHDTGGTQQELMVLTKHRNGDGRFLAMDVAFLNSRKGAIPHCIISTFVRGATQTDHIKSYDFSVNASSVSYNIFNVPQYSQQDLPV